MQRVLRVALTVAAALLLASAAYAKGEKVDVCHFSDDDPCPHTISISINAVGPHLVNHGDLLGACETLAEVPCGCREVCGDACIAPGGELGRCRPLGPTRCLCVFLAPAP